MSGGAITGKSGAAIPQNMEMMPYRQPQSNYQTTMPTFEQLVGGGYNPMASIYQMQRQPIAQVQNPFFGGQIPIDFGLQNNMMASLSPTYVAGSANRAYEAEQARIAAEKAAQQLAAQQQQYMEVWNPFDEGGGSYMLVPQQSDATDSWAGQFGDTP